MHGNTHLRSGIRYRAAGAVSAVDRGAGHRRRRHDDRVIWPGILSPHAVDLSAGHWLAGRRVLRSHRPEQHGQRHACRHPLVHGRRHSLLPHRPARKARLREATGDLDGAGGDGSRDPGRASAPAIPTSRASSGRAHAYEGLTCDALEWQVSNGGGDIIEEDLHRQCQQPAGHRRVRARQGLGRHHFPEGVTTYKEEDARGVWQAGNAAFMRNWPYAYSPGQAADSAIRDKFDVTPAADGRW